MKLKSKAQIERLTLDDQKTIFKHQKDLFKVVENMSSNPSLRDKLRVKNYIESKDIFKKTINDACSKDYPGSFGDTTGRGLMSFSARNTNTAYVPFQMISGETDPAKLLQNTSCKRYSNYQKNENKLWVNDLFRLTTNTGNFENTESSDTRPNIIENISDIRNNLARNMSCGASLYNNYLKKAANGTVDQFDQMGNFNRTEEPKMGNFTTFPKRTAYGSFNLEDQLNSDNIANTLLK